MVLTSYEFIKAPNQPRLITTSITRNALEYDARAITEAILGMTSIDPTPDRIDLPFGSVRVDPMHVNGYSYSNGYDEHGTQFRLRGVRISISTSSPDDRYTTLSKRRLAEEFIENDAWGYNTYTSESDLYPGNTSELPEVNFAGYPAVLCEAKLFPPEPWTAGNRAAPALMRIYGFLHGNRYSTVVIKQEGDLDPQILDEIASLFDGISVQSD